MIDAFIFKNDFMHLTVTPNTYDAAYAIEATVHSPDLAACYHEIFKALKPGCCFACYEWCLTDKFDPQNSEHIRMKRGIEIGNGIVNLMNSSAVLEAVKKAGFEVLNHHDEHVHCNEDPYQTPWYETFTPSLSFSGWKHTRLGTWFTQQAVNIAEYIHLLPTGSAHVHQILIRNSRDLVESGKLGIFTPGYFFLARKPAVSM
jgi:sterol 24-C-methyltransferase